MFYVIEVAAHSRPIVVACEAFIAPSWDCPVTFLTIPNHQCLIHKYVLCRIENVDERVPPLVDDDAFLLFNACHEHCITLHRIAECCISVGNQRWVFTLLSTRRDRVSVCNNAMITSEYGW